MTGGRPPGVAQPGALQALACEALAHVRAGQDAMARTAYGEVVLALQRRASRLALYYLRDASEADEAVQDAFVKAFVHLRSYNDSLPFDAWFTRILINGCLDRLKSRKRRWQWFAPLETASDEGRREPRAPHPSPEDLLLAGESRARLAAAIGRLPDRQRLVMTLTHLDGRTPREISGLTGMNESTIRVHLFRALRRLRTLLATEALDARDVQEAEA